MSIKDRWTNITQTWPRRYREIVKQIHPGSSILDIGCGTMELKNIIPEGCKYVGLDYIKRDKNTVVCDLNDSKKDLIAITKQFDYSVCSGVLEYIIDADRFVKWISGFSRNVILSYYIRENRDSVKVCDNDWVNNFSLFEIVDLFAAQGFEFIEMATIAKQKLFVFRRLS